MLKCTLTVSYINIRDSCANLMILFDRERETKASAMWVKETEVNSVPKRRVSSVDEPLNMKEETMVRFPFSL